MRLNEIESDQIRSDEIRIYFMLKTFPHDEVFQVHGTVVRTLNYLSSQTGYLNIINWLLKYQSVSTSSIYTTVTYIGQ